MTPQKPTKEEALAMLDELYASLPALECKGRCHDTCTAIDASELERQRIAERGVTLPEWIDHGTLKALIASGATPRCPALSPLNTCRVYEVRPLICRAFGMTHDPRNPFPNFGPMMCDHGCVPDGTISLQELSKALREIEALSREVTGVSRVPSWPS